MDYILVNTKIENQEHIDDLYSNVQNAVCSSLFWEEIVINTEIINSKMLAVLQNKIRQCRFGIFQKLPMVNLIIDSLHLEMLMDINNEIDTFMTPIIILDIQDEEIDKKFLKALELLESQKWKPYFLFQVKNKNNFLETINVINRLECLAYNKKFKVVIDFKGKDVDLFESALINIDYIWDTIYFAGMSQNKIVKNLKKAIIHENTGVYMRYEKEIEDVIKRNKMHIKMSEKKDLVRDSMDDYAQK